MMEAGEHDIVFENGQVHRRRHRQIGRPVAGRAHAFQPARLPPGIEPGLFETGTFDGGERTYPNGCHVSEVEIDETTGEVELVRYTAVDDVGHMINPLLVEGQLHGGIAQGVGQALIENIVYDGSGQLVSGSFMDYAHAARGSISAPSSSARTRCRPRPIRSASRARANPARSARCRRS